MQYQNMDISGVNVFFHKPIITPPLLPYNPGLYEFAALNESDFLEAEKMRSSDEAGVTSTVRIANAMGSQFVDELLELSKADMVGFLEIVIYSNEIV
ncbi:unnamed protein product [Lactuca saligna]|uniref:Uncharacterized protein n=1 Tax=Lactuca saligna TaxID=75948 RepID=A0AA35VQW3_LACSI|nr:unnamed protein product [Lactuca saligna]